MGLSQFPQFYEFTTTSEGTTRLSDFVSDYREGRRYQQFTIRVKDEGDTCVFYIGSSDVTLANKKGLVGSGDSGAFGAITEVLNFPSPRYTGIDLSKYYLAHPDGKDYILIIY